MSVVGHVRKRMGLQGRGFVSLGMGKRDTRLCEYCDRRKRALYD
jgi:hypothetical protein